jgi:tetratricopeptide (TPR) repeat protein
VKQRLLLLLLMVTVATARAQFTSAEADTAFKFTHRLSRSVNHWIAFPKDNATGIYPFGYLYIDPSQGFLFNLEGFFTSNGNGKFTRIKRKIDETTRLQYILKPGPKPLVAIIEQDHNEELDIDPRPDWYASYNDYTDTAAHCVEWAKAYNGIKDHEMALSILQEPYRTAPHTPGLEVELCHSYYQLKRFDEAIKVAEAALLNDVGNAAIYKELGNAQLSKGRLDEAISTYTSGIKLCDAGPSDDKSEMAMYTAVAYGNKGNKEAYKKWLTYARLWAPKKSEIAALLDEM